MTKRILDFTNCKDRFAMHKVLFDGLNFKNFGWTWEDYGKNMDALWDLMKYYCVNVSVEVYNTSAMPKVLHDYVKIMFEVFDDVVKEDIHFQYTIIS